VETPANELRGRAQVRLSVRKNLVFIDQSDRSHSAVILKDPVSRQFFRLDARQRFAVSLMDGTRTLGEVRLAYEEAHRPDRLPLEDLESFAAQLLADGLAEAETPLSGRLLFEQAEKRRRRAWRSRLLQVLWLRIPLCDPDRWLARLLPWTRFLFTVPAVLCSLVFFLAALGLVVTHWDEFLQKLPGRQALFEPRTLVYLWLSLGLAKIVHEWGHGQCCKAMGGEVHEAGVMLLFLFPALYCNVSDAWQMPRRRQRMAISAAGVYVELLLASAATFVWWLSTPGSMLHDLTFGLMVASGIHTVVFNANPLMRCDGYYLLADWMDVPNLAEQSSQALRASFLRWLGCTTEFTPYGTATGRRFLLLYAAASWLYRACALGLSLYVLHLWLKPRKLAILGAAVAALAIVAMIGVPAWNWLRELHQQRSFREMKPLRAGLIVAIMLAVAIAVLAVPLPVHVEAMAVVQVEPTQVVRITVPPCGGILARLLVHDGQSVHEGQVLAVLTNAKQDIAMRVNEADQQLRLRQQQDLVAYLAESRGADIPVGQEFELLALRQQHAALKKQEERMTLRAPRAGVVMGLCTPEDVGKWLDGGSELCRVGNPQSLRMVLLTAPGDRQHGCGSRAWEGSVTGVAQAEAGQVPPQLTSSAGGDVVTRPDPLSKLDKPAQPHFLVTVQFTATGQVVHPGVLGRARIDAGSQTLWWRCRRYLANTFNWGL
jgi:putative peptide zinc metalloprotease protein